MKFSDWVRLELSVPYPRDVAFPFETEAHALRALVRAKDERSLLLSLDTPPAKPTRLQNSLLQTQTTKAHVKPYA